MQSKTRIFIVHMKEIIYTLLFILLGLALIFLMIYMFSNKKTEDSPLQTQDTYTAGIYTSSILLNDQVVDVSVVVDPNQIKSVALVNMETAVATMYPLLETCVDNISQQLISGVPLYDITYDTNNQYTSMVLLEAINQALSKATH